jgi:hypothetical protein
MRTMPFQVRPMRGRHTNELGRSGQYFSPALCKPSIVDGKRYMVASKKFLDQWRADSAENIRQADAHWTAIQQRQAAQLQWLDPFKPGFGSFQRNPSILVSVGQSQAKDPNLSNAVYSLS